VTNGRFRYGSMVASNSRRATRYRGRKCADTIGTVLVKYRERKCVDTVGTVSVPWAGHFRCLLYFQKYTEAILSNNSRKMLWFIILVIISFPSPALSFILELILSFSANTSHCSLSKKTWKEVVREDCQARKLNKEDAMDRCKWRKMIKEAR